MAPTAASEQVCDAPCVLPFADLGATAPPRPADRNLFHPDRPPLFHRILFDGAERLTDAELLAVLLPEKSDSNAPARAELLLREAGSLVDLVESRDLLLLTPGTELRDVAAILAFRELSTRLTRGEIYQRTVLDTPEKVARYLALRYSIPDQEVMGALFLDVRSQVIADREVFRGAMCRMAVEPRQLLRLALQFNAYGILLFHTHPSGSPQPSTEDLAFTDRVRDASIQVGIRLVDHMILGRGGRWISLQRRRPW